MDAPLPTSLNLRAFVRNHTEEDDATTAPRTPQPARSARNECPAETVVVLSHDQNLRRRPGLHLIMKANYPKTTAKRQTPCLHVKHTCRLAAAAPSLYGAAPARPPAAPTRDQLKRDAPPPRPATPSSPAGRPVQLRPMPKRRRRRGLAAHAEGRVRRRGEGGSFESSGFGRRGLAQSRGEVRDR